MSQQTGETRDAIIEDDNRQITEILNKNSHRRDPYWIVVFAKPSRTYVDGKPTLMKHIKAYSTKPNSQVGMIIGEVNNVDGTVKWEVNQPQAPFDYDKLVLYGAQEGTEVVTETTTIPGAYITK